MSDFTYILGLPEVTAAVVAAVPSNGPLDRRGIIIPVRRDGKQDFANSSETELIVSNVRQILGTRIGELRWNPEFGSLLHTLRHRNNQPLLQQLAQTHVLDALRRWEPRVRVTPNGVTTSILPRKLLIRVRFGIVDPNSPGVVVVPNLTASVPVLPLAA